MAEDSKHELKMSIVLDATDATTALGSVDKKAKSAADSIQDIGTAGKGGAHSIEKMAQEAQEADRRLAAMGKSTAAASGSAKRVESSLHKIKVTAAHADDAIGKMARGLQGATSPAERLMGIFGKLGGVLTGLGIGGLVSTLPGAVSNFFTPNVSRQTMGLEYATGFALQGVGTHESNLANFKELEPLLIAAGLSSPGSASGMAKSITSSASVLAKAGATNQQQASYGELSTLLGMVLMGGDVDLATSQLRQMMLGGAGADNTASNLLAAPLGEELRNRGLLKGETSFEALNTIAKNNPAQYFDAMLAAMQPLKKVGEEYGDSFVGLSSTIEEFTEQARVAFGQPLYEFATNQMRKLAGWLEKNSDTIQTIAGALGRFATGALEKITSATSLLVKNIDWIGAGLAIIYARKKAIAAIQMFTQPLPVADYLSQLKTGLSGLSAQVQAPFLSVASGARDMVANRGNIKSAAGGFFAGLNPIGKGAQIKGALAGSVTGGLGILKGLGAALMQLGTVLVPVVILVSMVAGAFMNFRDMTRDMTRMMYEQIDALMVELDILADQFGGDSGIMGALKSFAQFMGDGVLGIITAVTAGLRVMVEGWNGLIIMMSSFAKAIAPVLQAAASFSYGDLKTALSGFGDTFMDSYDQGMKENLEKRNSTLKKKAEERVASIAEKKKEDAVKGRPHINVTIQQNIKTDANPERIAYATRTILEREVFNRPRTAFDYAT